jgi:hypothetical protein
MYIGSYNKFLFFRTKYFGGVFDSEMAKAKISAK